MTRNDDHETATRVWERMRTLVHDRYGPRTAVSDALGMSFVRAKALRRLAAGPMSMRELADRLAIDRPYTTLIVDDLETRGLVERRIDPADRRSRIVTMTPEGAAAATLAESIISDPPGPLLALDPADLAALDRILAVLMRD